MSRNLSAAVLAASVALLISAIPVLAHHSEAAEFDATKPVRVTGVVKKVEWTNPHIWFYVEGKDEVSGQQAVWGFSGAAPNGLRRRGITRDSLKVGDTVKVQGIRAKDGSPNAASRGVTFSDGRQVFTASEQTPAPK
ncbi:MAG TPA: DUF6152 family protein [Vicinamibacterales bacterium]|jgi:Family of unknown function (DUF6152)|nr:DUF6152 family protein [Vicinamibacterales bacterium]